ncbi:hypothetical protein [Streptomyces sp. PT12]|nr:hypothetical protein [Streptomyces sp. PT12]
MQERRPVRSVFAMGGTRHDLQVRALLADAWHEENAPHPHG